MGQEKNLTNKPNLEQIVFKQDWLESEKGWGQRPDGCSLHFTEEDGKEFIKEYWDRMPEETPDEYSHPYGELIPIKVSNETYQEILKSKNGCRYYSIPKV